MKLSILMPNYNYAHYVEKAIFSIFQSKKANDFEIILIDDASTDNSWEVLQRLAKNWPQIRLFRNPKNIGVIPTLQAALEKAQGEYLHFFSSDDLYLPCALDDMFSYIKAYPDVPLFCSAFCFFSSDTAYQKMLHFDKIHFFSPREAQNFLRRTNFWIRGQTIFVKKAIYQKYLPLWPELRFAADFALNHNIAFHEGFCYIPKALFATRMHPHSYVAKATKKEKRDVWLFLFDLFEKKQLDKELFQTGVFRWLGVKSIYRDLLFTPKYWKYLFPICYKVLGNKFHCLQR